MEPADLIQTVAKTETLQSQLSHILDAFNRWITINSTRSWTTDITRTCQKPPLFTSSNAFLNLCKAKGTPI